MTAGPLSLSAHLIFESLAYAVGFYMYSRSRRLDGDFLSTSDRFSVITAAVIGAALGSRILYWFEDPVFTLRHIFEPFYLLAGKTVVGGLLGGTFAVEWVKRRAEITRRTGDLFAIPIVVAMAIGRIGCFLEGLPDHTYGIATALPWGSISETAFTVIRRSYMKCYSWLPLPFGCADRAIARGIDTAAFFSPTSRSGLPSTS